MIIKIIWLLENAQKCSNTARNICCLAQKQLEIFAARLGLAWILFETELLENAWLGFQIPCSKSPSSFKNKTLNSIPLLFVHFYKQIEPLLVMFYIYSLHVLMCQLYVYNDFKNFLLRLCRIDWKIICLIFVFSFFKINTLEPQLMNY